MNKYFAIAIISIFLLLHFRFILYKSPAYTTKNVGGYKTRKYAQTFLITGGAGYIGSHAAAHLLELGHNVVVVDNLSRGSKKPIQLLSETFPKRFTFYMLDIGNVNKLNAVFLKHNFDAVWHFAAVAFTKESVEYPSLYRQNITENTRILIETILFHSVPEIVYSSTCAVYGIPNTFPITETTPTNPINPYGAAKLAAEKVLESFSNDKLKVRILRYFNVVGSYSYGLLGENPRVELRQYSRLWTACVDAMTGDRTNIAIRGNNFKTIDGTAIRDYIHVMDLVKAHVAVMGRPNIFSIYNVGTGKPVSVRQFVDACMEVSGIKIKVQYSAATMHDPPILYANPSKIMDETNWQPTFVNITDSLRTAWRYVSHPFVCPKQHGTI